MLRATGLWPFRLLSEPGLHVVAALFRGRPVPVRTVLGLRSIAVGSDPMNRGSRRSDASALRSPDLRALLSGQVLGDWTLGTGALEELERAFDRQAPGLTIEFGSGVSTLCLAYLARRAGAGSLPAVISIEQDADHAGRTREALARAGLDGVAAVVHAPLAMADLDGRQFSTHVVPPEVGELVGERCAEFVLVDGPAAENGARTATLPVVRQWLRSGALVMLDDALRDGELETARLWLRMGWIDVEGIVIRDKGILFARIR